MKIDVFERELAMNEYMNCFVNTEVFMNKCRQCRNYGQNWGCPPFDLDTEEWLGQFRKITIVCDKIDLSGETHESVTSFSGRIAAACSDASTSFRFFIPARAGSPSPVAMNAATSDVRGLSDCRAAIPTDASARWNPSAAMSP